jgi:hypothetical protein
MVKHPESVYSSSFTFFSLLGCCLEDSPLGELPPPLSPNRFFTTEDLRHKKTHDIIRF